MGTIGPFFDSQPADGSHAEAWEELRKSTADLEAESAALKTLAESGMSALGRIPEGGYQCVSDEVGKLADAARDLVKTADHAAKLANRLIDLAEKELDSRDSDLWVNTRIARAKKGLEEARKAAVDQLKQTRYFHRQAHWLLERFPGGELRDVEGLVKLVNHAELEKNDWSLTPGRYVGVAPEFEDEDFDFDESLRVIHEELSVLNDEAAELATTIAANFEELVA